jgi:hypothetical protein
MPYGLWPLLSPRAKCPRRGAAPAAPPQPGLRGRLGAAKAKGPKSTQCCAMIRQTACVAVVALLMASTGSAAYVCWCDYSSDGCSGDTTASGCWQDGECFSTPGDYIQQIYMCDPPLARRVPRVLLNSGQDCSGQAFNKTAYPVPGKCEKSISNGGTHRYKCSATKATHHQRHAHRPAAVAPIPNQRNELSGDKNG